MADGRARRLATPHVEVSRVSLPETLASIGRIHKATWSTSVAAQKFAFVAIDLPSSKPLEVGAKVWTRFQDNNGKPDPPTNHKIYKVEVTKTSDDGFSVDVKCDRDQTISERTPQLWASHRPINACPIPLDLYKLEAGLRPPKCPTTAVTQSPRLCLPTPTCLRRQGGTQGG